jgi:hypothetical protein
MGAALFVHWQESYPPPPETFAHIFFDCKFVYEILGKITRKFLGNEELTKELYFLGKKSDNEQLNKSHTFFFNTLRYCIWSNKLEKKVLNLKKIESELIYLISISTGCSKKLEEQINTCNIFQNGEPGRLPDDRRP